MARAFDLILSEYAGYTDESVLDLTLGRIRQMVSVIQERRRELLIADRKFSLRTAELEATAIIGALAGVARTQKASSAIAKLAKKVDFVGPFEKAVGEAGKSPDDSLPSTGSVLRALGVSPDGQAGKRA